MQNTEWPAEDYAVGSYIQATVADSLLPGLHLNPKDTVLDVGCGNGAYTKKILKQVPDGSVLGIDSSENMLRLSKEVSREYPNFSVEKENVLTMNYENQFDKVVSFWCLQWADDIKKAFGNILNALKPGGKLFTIFPAGDDPFIMAYYALKESGDFPCLNDFKTPVDYKKLDKLAEQLQYPSAAHINVDLHHTTILLPSLDFYKKFVKGIAFYQGQVAEQDIPLIQEAMASWYEDQCQKKWQGAHQFEFSIYLVTGEKK